MHIPPHLSIICAQVAIMCCNCKKAIVCDGQPVIEMRAGQGRDTATEEYMCSMCFEKDYLNIVGNSEPPFFFDKHCETLHFMYYGGPHAATQQDTMGARTRPCRSYMD